MLPCTSRRQFCCLLVALATDSACKREKAELYVTYYFIPH